MFGDHCKKILHLLYNQSSESQKEGGIIQGKKKKPNPKQQEKHQHNPQIKNRKAVAACHSFSLDSLLQATDTHSLSEPHNYH